ncbi:hypothetical protein [Mailhella massiliensis]|uniref:hypothetical protein n=1 Tax=Mailhella massiliensis TaxID=1903261 RepID=UPI0023EFE87F|nr:hypothetical protein [Mailhella massiliensis]
MSHQNCEIVHTGKEHRTHVDGTFYNMPENFPCVLHDRNGCLCLSRERYRELVQMGIIHESTGGAVHKVNIRNGIASVEGYHLCEERRLCPRYRARKS